MKKAAALIITLSLMLCGCGTAQPEPETDDTKLQIVCSCFPAYDFAREIAGDRAQITLLLKPGAEVHSYEPSPKDIIRIQESDLFICNGGESEEWVESLIDDDANVIYMMDCVDAVEESDEGIYSSGHDGHEHEETELDEHVWTSPLNAVKIARQICDELCEVDKDGSREYIINFEVYQTKLLDLDIRFRTTVLQAERSTLVFADRFPMRYFTLEYGLNYYAAFPGCASETEPSAKTVAFLIDHVREENIPAVLYMEFSNEKMADVICEDTGCKKLPFYSAHSVTAEQFEAGVTYLDLMEMNLDSLKEALN
ncbi:MAG: metal ABC transporter substrate-binding protein [Oscillospiraceae bacterium]